MANQTREQKKTVQRVMHEFRHGELESSHGDKVRNPRQAIAVALSEAGASNQQSPAQNKRQLSRTKSKERHGETAQQQNEGRSAMDKGVTREALYEQARQRGIAGRSHMTKTQLERALGR